MADTGTVTLVSVLMVSSLVLLIGLVVSSRRSRLDNRLEVLGNKGAPSPPVDPLLDLAQKALPKMGTAFLPKSEEERTRLQTRLVRAGLYSRKAMVVFLGVKALLMISMPILG